MAFEFEKRRISEDELEPYREELYKKGIIPTVHTKIVERTENAFIDSETDRVAFHTYYLSWRNYVCHYKFRIIDVEHLEDKTNIYLLSFGSDINPDWDEEDQQKALDLLKGAINYRYNLSSKKYNKKPAICHFDTDRKPKEDKLIPDWMGG